MPLLILFVLLVAAVIAYIYVSYHESHFVKDEDEVEPNDPFTVIHLPDDLVEDEKRREAEDARRKAEVAQKQAEKAQKDAETAAKEAESARREAEAALKNAEDAQREAEKAAAEAEPVVIDIEDCDLSK